MSMRRGGVQRGGYHIQWEWKRHLDCHLSCAQDSDESHALVFTAAYFSAPYSTLRTDFFLPLTGESRDGDGGDRRPSHFLLHSDLTLPPRQSIWDILHRTVSYHIILYHTILYYTHVTHVLIRFFNITNTRTFQTPSHPPFLFLFFTRAKILILFFASEVLYMAHFLPSSSLPFSLLPIF